MECQYHTLPRTEQVISLEKLPAYEYAPLASKTNFRLFKLSHGASNTPIRGSIVLTDLHNLAREYVALSYAWGRSAPSHAIECDGKRLVVNCNVFSALSRLRREYADVYWFIDFICINQALEEAWLNERAAQVRMMDAIYTHATRVVIDLGDRPEHMNQIEALMTECCSFSPESLAARVPELDALQAPPYTSEVWHAFVSLYQRPWFHRIWVLQEYALAKAATVVIGTEHYSPDLVLDSICQAFEIAEVANVNQEEMAVVRSATRAANTLAGIMQQFKLQHRASDGSQSIGQTTLAAALKETLTFDATDPRDRVYGLLGLINGTNMSDFRIDYKESVGDLSRRLSRFLLYQGAIFDLFYILCGLSTDGLASWMPDLSQKRRPTGIERQFFYADHIYNAGGKGPIKLMFPNDCTSLTLEGIVLDRVRIVSAPFPAEPEKDTGNFMSKFTDLVREWDFSTLNWVLGTLSGSSHKHQDVLRDYRLTITGGGHALENYAALQSPDLTEFLYDTIDDPEAEKRARSRASMSRVYSLMSVFCERKCVVVTQAERLSLVPRNATNEDVIVLFRGFPTPFLLRKREDGNYFLLGAAYLCGAMHGEFIEMLDRHVEEIEVY